MTRSGWRSAGVLAATRHTIDDDPRKHSTRWEHTSEEERERSTVFWKGSRRCDGLGAREEEP
jgi:hypothetical protein